MKSLYSRENGVFYVSFLPLFFLGTDSLKNISLIESAAAFSSTPSPKCLLEKIDVVTGEEAEHNVLKVCISTGALSASTCIHEANFYKQEHLSKKRQKYHFPEDRAASMKT